MIITKEFIRDLKECKALVVRFNGKYSTIDVFRKNGNSRITYDFEATQKDKDYPVSIYIDQATEQTTFINNLKVNQKAVFFFESGESNLTKERDLTVTRLCANITTYKRDKVTINKIEQWLIDYSIVSNS